MEIKMANDLRKNYYYSKNNLNKNFNFSNIVYYTNILTRFRVIGHTIIYDFSLNCLNVQRSKMVKSNK